MNRRATERCSCGPAPRARDGTWCRTHRLGAASDRERGSATVLGLALAAGILLLVLALGALAGAIATRGATQSAADLAALAAAGALTQTELRGVAPTDGVSSACALAADAVRRNGVQLESCRVVGVRTIEIETSRRFANWGEARAWARAGPRP